MAEPEEVPAPTEPPEGVTAWTNPHNGFRVVQVHYSADPEKRSPAWKAKASSGMPTRGWLREYEINFSLPEGVPVFQEFQAGDMVRDIRVLPGARLLRFWDFGHVSPVCLLAQLDPWARLCILREIVLQYASIDVLLEAVLGATADLMGSGCRVWDAGDPAGESMTDLGAVSQILMGRGILLQTIRSRLGSYAALRTRLMGRTMVNAQVSPLFLVRPECTTLIRALSGAFHLNEQGKPVDTHPWKDVCDALRYGNDNLAGQSDGHLEEMKKMARVDWAWQ
jgi:hypothetical protein